MEPLSCSHKPGERLAHGSNPRYFIGQSFLSVIDLGMDDRPGYGVDEDVVVNAAGDGTDLIHGVEAGLHRLAWLLTLLCRRLLTLGYCLPLLWVLLRSCLRRRQFLRRLEGRGRPDDPGDPFEGCPVPASFFHPYPGGLFRCGQGLLPVLFRRGDLSDVLRVRLYAPCCPCQRARLL